MSNATIKHTRLTLIALAMSAVFLLPGVAGADGNVDDTNTNPTATAAICNYEMQKVFQAIDEGYFLGRESASYSDYIVRDQQRMHDRWHEAVKKLNKGKYGDADDKLTSIRDKASDLMDAHKTKLEDDGDINTAVGAALDCIP